MASIRRQARETTTPKAPDEPLSGRLRDSAPLLLECISELVDVLWLERPSLDTSPEDAPQTFNWRQVWGPLQPWESRESAKVQVILNIPCTMGSCNVVFKNEMHKTIGIKKQQHKKHKNKRKQQNKGISKPTQS